MVRAVKPGPINSREILCTKIMALTFHSHYTPPQLFVNHEIRQIFEKIGGDTTPDECSDGHAVDERHCSPAVLLIQKHGESQEWNSQHDNA